ncbi:hypothetical protein ACN95_03220 [Gordonia sihwensis]|nr:hypothetical protein [Gordonia sihwensis]
MGPPPFTGQIPMGPPSGQFVPRPPWYDQSTLLHGVPLLQQKFSGNLIRLVGITVFVFQALILGFAFGSWLVSKDKNQLEAGELTMNGFGSPSVNGKSISVDTMRGGDATWEPGSPAIGTVIVAVIVAILCILIVLNFKPIIATAAALVASFGAFIWTCIVWSDPLDHVFNPQSASGPAADDFNTLDISGGWGLIGTFFWILFTIAVLAGWLFWTFRTRPAWMRYNSAQQQMYGNPMPPMNGRNQMDPQNPENLWGPR